jgi:two-component sensor histidine kinase
MDEVPIGSCNVNEIEFGKTANSHLHIWNTKNRKSGVGSYLLNESIALFFINLKLEQIVCEPKASNPAPNTYISVVKNLFKKSKFNNSLKITLRFYLVLFCSCQSFAQTNNHQDQVDAALVYVNNNLFSETDSALSICQKALSLSEPNSSEYAQLIARRAIIYDLKGQTELAVEGLLDAITIQKEIGDSIELSYSYNNLGISYFYTYRYDAALKYYDLSAEIDSLLKDFQGWAGTKINKAIILSNTKRYDQADHIYDLVLNQMELLGDKSLHGALFSNKAKLNVVAQDFQQALENIEKARPFTLAQNNPSPMMTLEVIKSNALFRLGEFDDALVAARQGLAYDQDSVFIERRVHLFECMAHAFYAMAKIDSGEYYNDLHQSMRDDLFNKETQSSVQEIQTQYNVAEFELEEERLKNIANEEAKLAAESKAQRNLFVGLAVISVMIGFLLFYRNRVKKAEQQVLEEKLNLQDQLIQQKEAFIGEIHHRVKNNLQLVASMLAIQSSQTENKEVKAVFEGSKSRIEAMSLIHEKLYQSTDFEQIQMDDYIKNLVEQIVAAYTGKNSIQLKLAISKITLHIDSVVPLGLVINELLTNSIKYAFETESNPEIEVRFNLNKELLILEYGDNGCGYKAEKKLGFGSHLLGSLARQLKAKTNENGDSGYYYKLTISKFKLIK